MYQHNQCKRMDMYQCVELILFQRFWYRHLCAKGNDNWNILTLTGALFLMIIMSEMNVHEAFARPPRLNET